MIEQGIILLVNSGIASPPFAGGFPDTLPKNAALPNWSYKVITNMSERTLTRATNRLAFLRIEINCYGDKMSDAMSLATSIDKVLDGFFGILPDPDLTYMGSCFKSDEKSFFDESPRSFRRMIEYEILYAQSY